MVNGGFAFPAEGPSKGQFENPGMSLRDWFAGETDIPLDVAANAAKELFGEGASIKQALVTRAHLRYAEADAMIAERDKEA